MIASVNAPARHLRLLAEVLALVESEHVSAPHLVALHARLAATGDTASHRIAQLTRLVDLLESRQNQIFAPVALLLLWGTQLAWAIEIWRRRSGPSLSEWMAVAGEFEALSSLAGYAFEHPGDPFPDIVGGGPVVEGTALAHPLLPAVRVVVANDVALGVDVRVLVVSGSNMSGKSTLLRTVGVNVVLALAGAPVRARRMALSPVALGATLRIQDSLQAGQVAVLRGDHAAQTDRRSGQRARSRCCSCSTSCWRAPTRTTAGSARPASCRAWWTKARSGW